MALKLEQVIAARNAIVLLKQLPTIITPETQADAASARQSLDGFFSSAEVRDELIGAWFACNQEYAPLINALVPVVNRVVQCLQQRATPAQPANVVPLNGGPCTTVNS